MKSWQLVAFGLMLGLLSAALILLVIMRPGGDAIEILPPPTPSPLIVDVSGGVNTPGLYTLPADARVADAIEAAGGLIANADTSRINLAAWLKDGDKVWVPMMGEEPNTMEELPSRSSSVALNINTATASELETLPGIGEVKAAEIVAYREEHGLFLSLDDLLKVPGIGPELLEKMRPGITLSD